MKLFRRIREKLLAEGKITNYFKYALGEIILVVIGILIALQLNNWKENQKLHQLENQIYTELKSDLIQTKNDILNTISQHKAILKANQQLIYAIHDKKTYSDTIYSLLAKTGNDFKIIPKTSAFENLKNIGLNTLSNDSLRIAITNLFQLDLKRLDDELEWTSAGWSLASFMYPYQNKYLFADTNDAITYGFKHSDSITIYKLKIRDYPDFLTDGDLMKALQMTLYNRGLKVDLETETVHAIDKVINGIEDELESRNE